MLTSWTGWSYDNWRSNAPNNGNGNSEQDCVILKSDGVWDDVLTADGNNNNAWLGATDTASDGTWVWEDETGWSYQNWWASAALGTQGGTVQNCLQLRRIDLTWDDTKCAAEKWYVCKK